LAALASDANGRGLQRVQSVPETAAGWALATAPFSAPDSAQERVLVVLPEAFGVLLTTRVRSWEKRVVVAPAVRCRGHPVVVPTISRFYGIVIRMYFADHAPPHFHAVYAGEEAVIAITTLEVIRGGLPDRALRMVREWASIHRDELVANWERVQLPDQPVPIAPLP
jgi:hypothetical protein